MTWSRRRALANLANCRNYVEVGNELARCASIACTSLRANPSFDSVDDENCRVWRSDSIRTLSPVAFQEVGSSRRQVLIATGVTGTLTIILGATDINAAIILKFHNGFDVGLCYSNFRARLRT